MTVLGRRVRWIGILYRGIGELDTHAVMRAMVTVSHDDSVKNDSRMWSGFAAQQSERTRQFFLATVGILQ